MIKKYCCQRLSERMDVGDLVEMHLSHQHALTFYGVE